MEVHRGPLFNPAGSLAEGNASCSINPEIAGWVYSGLTVLDLEAGDSQSVSTQGREVAVLPLSGACRVDVDGESFELTGRASVFEGVTDWAYVGVGSRAVVTAEGVAQIALCSAVATRRIEP